MPSALRPKSSSDELQYMSGFGKDRHIFTLHCHLGVWCSHHCVLNQGTSTSRRHSQEHCQLDRTTHR